MCEKINYISFKNEITSKLCANKWMMWDVDYYIAILEIIGVQKVSPGLFKNVTFKICLKITYFLYICINRIWYSWRQHPTRHQLYGHLPPITKTIQVRRARHAGHCWRSRDELIRDVLLWTPTHGRAKAGRPARTYIQQLCENTDVVQKTYLGRWTIGRSGERGSGVSVLPARYDDDD